MKENKYSEAIKMNNPYDQAHLLAKSLSNSNEYKRFNEIGTKLKAQPETLKQIQDFFRKQMEIEIGMMSGQAPDLEKTKELEELYRLIQLQPIGKEFFESQMRFQQLMSDIMKIVNESVSEGAKILTEKV